MNRATLKNDIHLFVTIVAILITIGFLFIYSSSSVYALDRYQYAHYYIKKQALGLLLGIFGAACLQKIPLSYIQKKSPLIFFLSLFLTSLTLTPFGAVKIHGSSRWLSLFGFTFQPSELLKVPFVIYLAHFIAKKERQPSSFSHNYLPFLFILGSTCLLLLRQPDFGMSTTILFSAFLLLYIAHFQIKELYKTLLGIVPVLIGLIAYKPYRLRRVLTFLNPWTDPQGDGFQIIQSLIAIGTGNIWGTGISHSKQKFFYLPMHHTDFIFSIIAEETGFVGCLLLIVLYCCFSYIGMRIAWHLKDPFCTFATLGFVIMISLQAILNMAVASGLAPTKGMGLPFISYGNTALIANILMIGFIVKVANEQIYYRSH